MNILTLPLRNIRRKPTKTLLLLLVFSLGVMSIVALYQVSRVIGENFEKKLTAFGANIIISPNTEKLSVSYGGFNMGEMFFDIGDMPEEDTTRAIQHIELSDRISAVAPKLVTMARIGETAVAVVGVRWEQERAMKGYWAVTGNFPSSQDQLLVGGKVAQKLGLAVGESIEVLGRPFTLAAVLYETGSDDDSVIFLDLGILQQLLKRPDATSFIEVAALCSGCPIEDIVSQLQQQLPGTEVKALQNIVNQRMASVHFVQHLALSVSLVILITGAAMVGLSMMSAVNERKKDIGILRSLGYGRGRIFFIFSFEAGILGMISGTMGYVCGYLASFKVLGFLAMAEGQLPIFSLSHLMLTCLLFTMVSIVAALYPSWRGARIEPSAALVAL